MRSLVQQQRWIWWMRPGMDGLEIVSAADPRIPAGLPAGVSVVGRKTRRGSVALSPVPCRVGTLLTWSGWAIHDPTCPATVHATFGIFTHLVDSTGGVLASYERLSPQDPVTTTQWTPVRAFKRFPAGYTHGRFYPVIDQDQNAACVWWIADGQGIILG